MWASFLQGVNDGCQPYIAMLLTMKSEKIRRKLNQTLLLNGGIFIGSMLFYQSILEPVFSWSYIQVGLDQSTCHRITVYMHYIFVALWIIPMYILSFVLNTVWLQDIANETTRLLVRRSPQAPTMSVTLRIADVAYKSIFNGVFILQSILVYNLSYVGYFLYVVHLAFLFSLTAFEYRLSPSDGWTSDRRLEFIQRRWHYFVGFGFAPAVFASLFPRFIEAGILALLLPLGIVAASTATPAQGVDQPGRTLPIFTPSVLLTAGIVRVFDLVKS
jgi:etoposide-induced 2.4 mRNA